MRLQSLSKVKALQFFLRINIFADITRIFRGKVTLSARLRAIKALRSARRAPASEILVILPTFNNPTYLKNMLSQLNTWQLKNIIISDSGSTYEPMRELLSELRATGYEVLEFGANVGPRVYWEDPLLFHGLPRHFILSDSDLEFNKLMPLDFSSQLIHISEKLAVGKVGVALELSDSENFRSEKFGVGENRYSIVEWENQFWMHKIPFESQAIYSANVDTTLALYNKDYFNRMKPYEAVRVAGDFTARHLPWYKEQFLPATEVDFYSKLNKIGFYGLQSETS
jgi:hypothetical protein